MVHSLKTKKDRKVYAVYRNEPDKACFQHDTAYGKSKDLAKRTQSDKFLRDKAFRIVNDPKYDGCQRGLASMVYNFLKRSLMGVVLLMNQIINLQMNFRIRLFENLMDKRFIHLLETVFGGVYLADTQSLSKYNKGIKYLLCAICFVNMR